MNLILITGFLGSGKTTFLTNLLKEFSNEKIGVIMNEFGEKGIDGTLIRNNNFDMIELNNGSIFCACIKDNFIQAIAEFTKHDINYLFIESTGLADPSNMENILDVTKKLCEKDINYLGSICIIDSLYFLKQFELLPALSRQVQYSDAVIINKTDLQTNDNINKIELDIEKLNKSTSVYKTSFCSVKIKEIISNLHHLNTGFLETTNTRETRPKSIVIKIKEDVSKEKFIKFLESICLDGYRIKGFVKTTNGTYEVSVVGSQINLTPWNDEVKNTEVIIISSIGIRIISKVTSEWNKYFSSKLIIKS